MLNIYINTWGNYNEHGADGGRWVSLPMEEDDLIQTMDDIAENIGDTDPEFFINDHEWTTDVEGRDIQENENILELNEYVQAIDDLDRWDKRTFSAAVELWGSEVDPADIDEYNLYSDIETDEDLGYYWAHESGCYDLDKMGPLANYIDYEAFGRDIRSESDGGFTSFGWIERT